MEANSRLGPRQSAFVLYALQGLCLPNHAHYISTVKIEKPSSFSHIERIIADYIILFSKLTIAVTSQIVQSQDLSNGTFWEIPRVSYMAVVSPIDCVDQAPIGCMQVRSPRPSVWIMEACVWIKSSLSTPSGKK